MTSVRIYVMLHYLKEEEEPMSLEYADQCVIQALQQAGGNQSKARQIIMSRAMEDADLLRALTAHHLKNIAAYHIERVASGRAQKGEKIPPLKKPKGKKTDEGFGMEILKAVAASGSAVFGMEAYASPQGRRAASQSHVDAIKQMAERSKTK